MSTLENLHDEILDQPDFFSDDDTSDEENIEVKEKILSEVSPNESPSESLSESPSESPSENFYTIEETDKPISSSARMKIILRWIQIFNSNPHTITQLLQSVQNLFHSHSKKTQRVSIKSDKIRKYLSLSPKEEYTPKQICLSIYNKLKESGLRDAKKKELLLVNTPLYEVLKVERIKYRPLFNMVRLNLL